MHGVPHNWPHRSLHHLFIMMMSSQGESFHITGLLWGESTDLHYWPLVKGNLWSPVDFPHKRPLMQSFDAFLLLALMSCWTDSQVTSYLTCHEHVWCHCYGNHQFSLKYNRHTMILIDFFFWAPTSTVVIAVLHALSYHLVSWYNIEGLVQERRNSIANALELHHSCINPSIYRSAA